MRTQFTQELHELTDSLTLMYRLAHDTVERGVDALAEADLAAAYEVFALEEQLRAAHGTCESRTVALLALQAPVARDLRHVVTAMQIAGQLAEIGALSSRVADQVYRRHPDHVAPQPILDVLVELGRVAATRIARVGTAAGTAPGPLRERLHAALTDHEHPHSPTDVVELTLLGSYLERCVEHADRIDAMVRFLDTGVPPTAQTGDGERQPAEI
ncbi:phosphate signaling complex PhoU family protein [Nocardia higoensis]|uniref:phosphate signaling complex PhoU family protein n=1 Tax=Nocardia higoensis TaxID=228599 RepID=UPI001FE1A06B|nr:PhoU domain-containing protein [Nocardia higoensis]